MAITDVCFHLAARKQGKSLRMLADELGLPKSSIAVLSRALRGLPISADSERMIGRALGVAPPPRTIPRITPSKAQRERRAALGVAWHDILEKGLACWEAQGNGNG